MLGLLGNSFDPESALATRVHEIIGGSAVGWPGHWPSDNELLEHYDDVQTREFAHEQRVSRPLLRDLALSRSRVARLPGPERRLLLGRLDALWDEAPELQGREVALLGYRTRVTRCVAHGPRRRAAANPNPRERGTTRGRWRPPA